MKTSDFTLTLMGTGTSHGIPVINCKCKVCTSSDPKNKRLRSSAFISDGITNIVIDTGPEFRIQALRQEITKLDAVLLTHDHADHMHGLDDVRIFSSTKHNGVVEKSPCKFIQLFSKILGLHSNGLKVYSNRSTQKKVYSHFDYIFKRTQTGGGKPMIDLWLTEKFNADNPIKAGNLRIIPVPMMHGNLKASGYLIYKDSPTAERKSIVYLTDCSFISPESIQLIADNCGTLKHCVIDGLRERPHSTHLSFLQAMEYADKLQPENTWFTHMTHDHSHNQITKYAREHLKEFSHLKNVKPAFDGLVLKV